MDIFKWDSLFSITVKYIWSYQFLDFYINIVKMYLILVYIIIIHTIDITLLYFMSVSNYEVTIKNTQNK